VENGERRKGKREERRDIPLTLGGRRE